MKPMKGKDRQKMLKGMVNGKSVHDMMGTHKMCSGAEKTMPKKDMKG